MSKISLTPNTSGTGTFTIASPNSNTDRTLTLPDATGTVATAESTLAQFNATGSAPVYAARAWVNFNGTGTVAIRASGNVSSITDNGVADYTVNFTTAMPDANYSALVTAKGESGLAAFGGAGVNTAFSAATYRVNIQGQNGASTVSYDSSAVSVAIFR